MRDYPIRFVTCLAPIEDVLAYDLKQLGAVVMALLDGARYYPFSNGIFCGHVPVFMTPHKADTAVSVPDLQRVT